MTFNVWTFLFEVLNFVVLAYVLHRLLYRPLHEAIDARRTAARKLQEDADKMRQEALALEEKLRHEQAEQERKQQDLIRSGREMAEAERQRLLADAEQAVHARQEEVRQALAREREEALQALHSEVIRQAIDAAGRVLREATDRTVEAQLAARLVQSLHEVSDDERQRLRGEWTAADGALLEVAADAATDLGAVRAAVTDLLGRPADLTVQVRPELLGGLRLRLGGHVWDASLAGQLGTPPCNGATREASHV